MAFEKLQNVVRNWWLFGLITGVLVLALSWVWKALGIAASLSAAGVTATFSTVNIDVKSQIAGGLNPYFGEKLFGFLGGLVDFTFPAIVMTIVSAMLLVIVGMLVYEYVPVFSLPFIGKSTLNKLFMTLFYGTAVATLLAVSLLNLPAWTTILAMLIYFVLLAAVMIGVEKLGLIEVPN